MIHALRVLYCRAFHRSLRHGGGRLYYCRSCGLPFAVPWAKEDAR